MHKIGLFLLLLLGKTIDFLIIKCVRVYREKESIIMDIIESFISIHVFIFCFKTKNSNKYENSGVIKNLELISHTYISGFLTIHQLFTSL